MLTRTRALTRSGWLTEKWIAGGPDGPFPTIAGCWEPYGVEQSGEVTVVNVSGPGAPVVAHRRPHASGVEPEGAAESAQPPADPNESRVIGQEVDWGSPVTEHQVERPVAAQLVGEVGPVGRASVVGVWGAGHRCTV